MVDTERWAEELTEKSKDKHHIEDFLPPDELARFMEKVLNLSFHNTYIIFIHI